MQQNLAQLSQQARMAVQRRDWASVAMLAHQIVQLNPNEPEGHFLNGLVAKARGATQDALAAFSKALDLDSNRYDAAIEKANQLLIALRHGEACELLEKHEGQLVNSPLYLDMAGRLYTTLGLHAKAWPLYEKANQLQPGVDMLQVNLAACGVLLGKVNESKSIYLSLVKKYPQHQRNHYELSKLEKATDAAHVEQMEQILKTTQQSHDKNIFLYYALAKELEDLGRWQESFHYYKLAGDSVSKVAQYHVEDDIKMIEQIIAGCSEDWIKDPNCEITVSNESKTPIFIVGLPRTGTTLTERIISSHSQVESADETFFMQMAIRKAAGVGGIEDVNEAIIGAAINGDIEQLGQTYMDAVAYRLADKKMFIDGFPFNFLYLGFIAKALPQAKIIYLKRNPMDACFAMYKQSFFKFAYSLEDLGRYYVAQNKLREHWQKVLGDRLIELDYEQLVAQPEAETRRLLNGLGLDFEQACMDFDKNPTASSTASTLQVREKVHTRSVNKWKKFEEGLTSLKNYLEQSGIEIPQTDPS